MMLQLPTLDEITQLTHQELTRSASAQENPDPIRECGRAALALLETDPETCIQFAYQKLHDVPYKEVKTCWRRLYVDAALWKVLRVVEVRLDKAPDWIDEAVRELDMGLILTGAPNREELVELWFAAFKGVLSPIPLVPSEGDGENVERPSKRRKITPSPERASIPEMFPTKVLEPQVTLLCPLARVREMSLSTLQAKVSDVAQHIPVVIEGALQHWPALNERPWNNPSYLLEQTLGGRRLVPVEVGKSYTDSEWGQKIISFADFMNTYMLHQSNSSNSGSTTNNNVTAPPQTGYLAQHDLFAQVPSLRSDISIPDYCFCDPAPSPHLTHVKPVPKLDEPLLNAWFGPQGTVSPLHTDPYHNILAQVVGYKYVRLYPPAETERMYPRGVDEGGVDMSNTSEVDLDMAMEVWKGVASWERSKKDGELSEDEKVEFEEKFGEFKNAKYLEGVLAPGECLYVPVGWWHYVRSLTPSFSVSFWFN